jgi:hypothetical protein
VNATLVDPAVTDSCANCGKERSAPTRARKGNDGTRMPVDLWTVSVERDPFCSAECCRIYHGLSITGRAPAELGSCPDCGKQHTTGVPRPHGNRCGDCSHKFRRARKTRERGKCSGCGGELDVFTDGCWACRERRRYRLRCQDPAFVEARRERDRERQRVRAAKKIASARRLATVEPDPTATAPVAEDFATQTTAAREAA